MKCWSRDTAELSTKDFDVTLLGQFIFTPNKVRKSYNQNAEAQFKNH